MTDPTEAMGLAVGRAMNKSAALLRAAAETGDAEAQFALALLYLLGRGVEKNSGEAFRLFGLAQAAGDEQAAAFRDMAAEQLAREQINQQQMQEAAAHVMKDAKRRQRFPKPHIVKPDLLKRTEGGSGRACPRAGRQARPVRPSMTKESAKVRDASLSCCREKARMLLRGAGHRQPSPWGEGGGPRERSAGEGIAVAVTDVIGAILLACPRAKEPAVCAASKPVSKRPFTYQT